MFVKNYLKKPTTIFYKSQKVLAQTLDVNIRRGMETIIKYIFVLGTSKHSYLV